MQPSQGHADYYRSRIVQERNAADRATDPQVRRLHVEMVDHYESLLASAQPPKFGNG